MVLEAEQPSAGTVRFPGFPYKLSDTPAAIRRPPPALGQHTEEVLGEVLGYSPDRVRTLRDQKTI
jgi:CoA:oxalate CoA-transferase